MKHRVGLGGVGVVEAEQLPELGGVRGVRGEVLALGGVCAGVKTRTPRRASLWEVRVRALTCSDVEEPEGDVAPEVRVVDLSWGTQ